MHDGEPWLRTNGVNTIGAAAKLIVFDIYIYIYIYIFYLIFMCVCIFIFIFMYGGKGTPWRFREDKSRLTGEPKNKVTK